MNHLLMGSALAAVTLGSAAAPAFADECSAVTAAMMTAARTPYSLTVNRTDKSGKTVSAHMVQTATTKYVETNGVWHSIAVSSEEMIETLNERLKTGKMTCTRDGTEAVNGKPATIYAVHTENDGTASDGRLWISSDRMVKSELHLNGSITTTMFDYEHVTPPSDAKPLGAK
jgi:hypothetical protein